MAGLQPVAEVSAGDWIAPRLHGPVGTVGSVVPGGFAAYARILHPVELPGGGPATTWARVCERTARTAHALMQWSAIAVPAGGAARSAPEVGWVVRAGGLAPGALAALVDVLAPFTGGQDCFHALWEGWAWVSGTGVAVLRAGTGDEHPGRVPLRPRPGVSPAVWRGPRLRTPGRAYLLFRGPLHAATGMGWRADGGRFDPQSPSLLWPHDRSWCVATEVDFDSTLVGGSRELIAAVLAAPDLETWPVREGDDLTASGDLVNRVR